MSLFPTKIIPGKALSTWMWKDRSFNEDKLEIVTDEMGTNNINIPQAAEIKCKAQSLYVSTKNGKEAFIICKASPKCTLFTYILIHSN